MRKIGHSGGKRGGLGRGKAGFALLIADVDLKENVLHDAQLFRLLFDVLQQLQPVDGLNEIDHADEILDLVGLQMADEVQGLSRVRAQRALGLDLLHAVLAAAVDACGDGFLHALGVVHLRRGAQQNFGRVASGFFCGLSHLGADARDIFSNCRHIS